MTTALAPRGGSDAGFSLLEALIGLAILAIASAALVGASEAHLDRVGGLEDRAVASWVAEEHLTGLRLASAPPAESTSSRDMAGRSWRINTRVKATSDPDLVRVDIAVDDGNSDAALARLSGFVDVGVMR